MLGVLPVYRHAVHVEERRDKIRVDSAGCSSIPLPTPSDMPTAVLMAHLGPKLMRAWDGRVVSIVVQPGVTTVQEIEGAVRGPCMLNENAALKWAQPRARGIEGPAYTDVTLPTVLHQLSLAAPDPHYFTDYEEATTEKPAVLNLTVDLLGTLAEARGMAAAAAAASMPEGTLAAMRYKTGRSQARPGVHAGLQGCSCARACMCVSKGGEGRRTLGGTAST